MGSYFSIVDSLNLSCLTEVTSHGKQIVDMLRNPVVQTAGVACYFAVSVPPWYLLLAYFAIAILHVPLLRMGARLFPRR